MTLKEFQTLLAIKGIPIGDTEASALEEYMYYILRKNDEVNLTAITDKDKFLSRMVFDSALPLNLVSFNNKKVLDIGTGAGYPGTVIATLTSADVTMLDSTKKKLKIIEEYPGAEFTTVNARAEEYAKTHRNTYDIVIARAVAELDIIMELAIPMVKKGGYFVAMKGPEYKKELENAKYAFKKLKCELVKTNLEKLPTGENRANLLIKKIDETPNRYPRSYEDIKKNPL